MKTNGKMNDAERIAAWSTVTDPLEALHEIAAHQQFMGDDPYYRDLNSALWEMVERVLPVKPSAPGLRWEKSCGDSWMAYSGKQRIGMVVLRLDKTIGYTIDGVPMRWVGKGYGDVSTISSGKRAVERGWRQWLTAAGLML